jgi:predicted MPP superfamily phosphohydrolase
MRMIRHRQSSMTELFYLAAFAIAAFGYGIAIAWVLCQLAAGRLPVRLVKVLDKSLAAMAVLGPIAVLIHALQIRRTTGQFPAPRDLPLTCQVVGLVFAAWGAVWVVRRIAARDYYRQQMVSDSHTVHDVPQEEVRSEWELIARLYGNQIYDLEVNRKTLEVPGLPAALDGLQIIHISDLHIQNRMPVKFFRRVAEQVRQLSGDVVVVSGDFVDNRVIPDWTGSELGKLCGDRPLVYCWGNHDVFALRKIEALIEPLGWGYCGVRAVEFEFGGLNVRFFGDERPWLGSILADREPGDSFDIAVCHSPDSWGDAITHGFPLSLAGHTHGGQVRLPIIGPIVAPSRHGCLYCCGTFSEGAHVLHVSRGIFSTYPLRVRCKPEVSQLTLRTKA